MNTNLQNTTDATYEATAPVTGSHEVPAILELLEAGGLAADTVFDGEAERCPHCLTRVLSEAA